MCESVFRVPLPATVAVWLKQFPSLEQRWYYVPGSADTHISSNSHISGSIEHWCSASHTEVFRPWNLIMAVSPQFAEKIINDTIFNFTFYSKFLKPKPVCTIRHNSRWHDGYKKISFTWCSTDSVVISKASTNWPTVITLRRVHRIAKRDYCLCHICLSVCLYVCLSVCPPVRPFFPPHATSRLPLDGFSWNLIFENISKICRENSSFIKIWQE